MDFHGGLFNVDILSIYHRLSDGLEVETSLPYEYTEEEFKLQGKFGEHFFLPQGQ
jgi:hypothetical protein